MIHVNARDDIKSTGEPQNKKTTERGAPNELDKNQDNNKTTSKLPEDQAHQTTRVEVIRGEHVEADRERVLDEELWNHAGQSYVIREWKTGDKVELTNREDSGSIACFFGGQKQEIKTRHGSYR